MPDIDLEATVKTLVATLIARGELFTALDVSNEVKKQAPTIRHRDVSPIVRDLYDNGDMGLYERTRIEVSTPNGPERAYLYHPVENTWDLDAKYNDQKRAQTATIPQVPVSSPDHGQLFGKVVADITPEIRAEVAAVAVEEKKDVPIVPGHTPLPDDVKAAMAEVKVMRAEQKKQAEELPPSIWSSLFSFMRRK